ncbi:MAG: hypothetical protein A2253_02215 [Deltaproteobacteria bacterium RIFOXYA2_FULL_55_11]|nr:MAG: hypothetical protein A2253_02215 [Deltaproteobacteria bacterium RIFOXYA2_FULL_55_11]
MGRKEHRGGPSQWLFFTLGLLPIVAIFSYFKLRLAPFNDPLLTQGWQPAIGKLGDLSRYLQVWKALLWELGSFGNWIIPLPLVLACYALVMGKPSQIKGRQEVGAAVGALFLVLVGYFLVYVLTPDNLDWHLKTSLARLLLQLWPSFIFVFFLLVNPVEPAIADRAS